MQFEERDITKVPLTKAELDALAKRVDDVRDLVKPLNKKDVEGLSDAEVIKYLVATPNSVRRPIIDTGDVLALGFTPAARALVEDALGKAAKKR